MDTKCYDVIDPDFSQPDYLPPCDTGGCRPCPPPPRPLPPCRPPKPGCTSNSTPWYGLPQWAAGDVTSWLMQMNGAMLRIDTIMHDLALRTGINGLPDDLVSCVAKLSQDMEVVKCTIGEMSNKQANVDLLMQNLNTQFSAMKTDVASLTLSVTNLDTRIMTIDSKADGMKNDIVLLKTDLNMLSKTVQNLTANFTSFQNSMNQSIAETQSSINELSSSIKNWKLITIEEAAFVHMNYDGDESEKFEITNTIENGIIMANLDINRLDFTGPRFTFKLKDGESVSNSFSGWVYVNIPNLMTELAAYTSLRYGASLARIEGTAPDGTPENVARRLDFYRDSDKWLMHIELGRSTFDLSKDISIKAVQTIPIVVTEKIICNVR